MNAIISSDDKWVWRWLGILSLIPFIPILVVIITNYHHIMPLLGITIGLSVQTSIIYSIFAVKLKIKWLAVWWLAFIWFIPFANILFWTIYFRNPKNRYQNN